MPDLKQAQLDMATAVLDGDHHYRLLYHDEPGASIAPELQSYLVDVCESVPFHNTPTQSLLMAIMVGG